jgi:hypothetical protein
MGQCHGRGAVVSFFTKMLEDWNAFIQGVLSGMVLVDASDPDRAKGRWFVEETGQRIEGANLSVTGVYHDEYVRDAGAWRIGRRRYDPLLIRADDATTTTTTLAYPADVPTVE